MNIKIVKENIKEQEVIEIGKEFFTDMVKGVVDIEKGIMAIGGDLHSDSYVVLVDNGSNPNDVWGINILFDKPKNERIEFESMMNIKVYLNNRSTKIQSKEVRDKITKIVDNLIE